MLFTMILPVFFGARSAFYAQPLADGIGAVMSTIAFLLIFKKHLEKRESATIGMLVLCCPVCFCHNLLLKRIYYFAVYSFEEI